MLKIIVALMPKLKSTKNFDLYYKFMKVDSHWQHLVFLRTSAVSFLSVKKLVIICNVILKYDILYK